jgi:hypothetical protein
MSAADPFPMTFLHVPDHRAGVVFGIAAVACCWLLVESAVLHASRLIHRHDERKSQ